MATGTNSRDLAVPDGEFPFTWADFRQIAELVHSEAGIVLTETKVNLVYSRLAKRLRAIGLRTFREYCALIQGGELEVGEDLHELVRFRELNLLREWPMRGRFDVIFCRNVMIYFDDDTQNTVWDRFADILHPGGTLCIGHSERIAVGGHPYDLVGQTIYRRQGA